MNILKWVVLSFLLLALVGCGGRPVRAEDNTAGIELPPPKDTVPGFLLYQSPIQPGGTWAVSFNFKNAWNYVASVFEKQDEFKIAKKQDALLTEYGHVLAESDSEFLKLKNNDSAIWTEADKDTYHAASWKEAVDSMRKEKFQHYMAELRADYVEWQKTGKSLLLPVPLYAPMDTAK